MAFWMDPFILLGVGVVIALLAKHVAPNTPHVVSALSALTMAVTYFIAVGLFVNADVLGPIWELMGAETGTEFMLNGVVLSIAESGLTWQELTSTQLFVAIVLFAIYPLFLAVGVGLGRILFGRHPDQEGLVGLARP